MKIIIRYLVGFGLLISSSSIGFSQATLTIGTVSSTPGSSTSLPIQANGISDMIGFQFTITYDKTKLTYVNCNNWGGGTNSVGVQITSLDGKVTFVYNDAAINITSGKFFDINFTIINGSSGSASINWSDNPTQRELSNSVPVIINCSYSNGIVNIVNIVNVPTLTTGTSLATSTTTATSGGDVTSDGGALVTARGVCWSTSLNPTTALSTKTSDGTGPGLFTSNIAGLAANTTYHVRAYAINSAGTNYGGDVTFTTPTVAISPTLTTVATTATSSTTATSGGNITSDGGASVTARGVCWSTSLNPTTALSTKTSDGTGPGLFTSNIAGLAANTTYHVRAYATNSAGTAYGADISFSTLDDYPNDEIQDDYVLNNIMLGLKIVEKIKPGNMTLAVNQFKMQSDNYNSCIKIGDYIIYSKTAQSLDPTDWSCESNTCFTGDKLPVNLQFKFAWKSDGTVYIGAVGTDNEILAAIADGSHWTSGGYKGERTFFEGFALQTELTNMKNSGIVTGLSHIDSLNSAYFFKKMTSKIFNRFDKPIYRIFSAVVLLSSPNTSIYEDFKDWCPYAGLNTGTGKRSFSLAFTNNINSYVCATAANDNSNSSYVKIDGTIVAQKSKYADHYYRRNGIYPSAVEIGTTIVWSSGNPRFSMAVVCDNVVASNLSQTPSGGLSNNHAPVITSIPVYVSTSGAETVLFQDNFTSLDNLILYGSPLPVRVSSFAGRTDLFDNNGDPNYNSGAITKSTFLFDKNITLTSEVYLNFSNLTGCWASAGIGIANATYQSWGGYDPTLYFELSATGDACWGTPSALQRHTYIHGGYQTDSGYEYFGGIDGVSQILADNLANKWTILKVRIDNNGIPSFYADNVLIYSGHSPLSSAIRTSSSPLWLGDRSSGSAGKAYHDFIKLTKSNAIVNISMPTLTTTQASGVTGYSAVTGGTISSDGGGTVTNRGVCWGTSANPTIALSTKTSDGTGIGSFVSNISGLIPGTTYHARAYATNSAGTAYGEDIIISVITEIENINESGINFYPNPVSDILNIEYQSADFKTINVLNYSGVLVGKEIAISPRQQIDFTKYEYGIYLLEFIKSSGGKKLIKVIKLY